MSGVRSPQSAVGFFQLRRQPRNIVKVALETLRWVGMVWNHSSPVSNWLTSSSGEPKPEEICKESTLASTNQFEMSQARHVKPYAEITDPERGSYGRPQQENLTPDDIKSANESGISLIDMASAREVSRVKPDKEAAYEEKETDLKVVTVIADPIPPPTDKKTSQLQVYAIRAGFVFLGEGELFV